METKIYWRRNQDLYLLVRNTPLTYRNLHITNKVAAELNGSVSISVRNNWFWGLSFLNITYQVIV